MTILSKQEQELREAIARERAKEKRRTNWLERELAPPVYAAFEEAFHAIQHKDVDYCERCKLAEKRVREAMLAFGPSREFLERVSRWLQGKV